MDAKGRNFIDILRNERYNVSVIREMISNLRDMGTNVSLESPRANTYET